MGGPFPGLRHLSLRHPPLQNDAAVATLLAHGNGLTWAQAAPVVVDLFVRPSLTLAVCGCFRRELLRLVVSLGELGGSEGRQGRSLSTVAVGVALLRAVEAAPRIRRVVLQHFLETPCPLDSISGGVLPDGLTDLEVARACLRGVRAVPELGQCWGPSWFVRLLKHEVADVRWCCVEAISHIRQLTDYNRERLAHLVLTEEETLGCLLRWQDDCVVYQLEAAAMWLTDTSEMADDENAMEVEEERGNASGVDAPAGYIEICGIELPCRGEVMPARHSRDAKDAPGFLWTASVLRSMEAATICLSEGHPLLLEGPPGCGKSSLVLELARLTGNLDMVTIHIDDQMDPKSLLGAYVSTAVPGEFTWQPGPLAQAVSQGRWLIIEDINLAPSQVLASLVPVLEDRKLPIPQRGEVLRASQGFQVIATITCSPHGETAGAYGNSDVVKEILGGLWGHVRMGKLPHDEELAILSDRFPALLPLLPFAMASLHVVRRATSTGPTSEVLSGRGDQVNWAELEHIVQMAVQAGGPSQHRDMSLLVGKHFSLRDLIKWCNRLQHIHHKLLKNSLKLTPARLELYKDINRIPAAVRQAALLEGCDCFCSLIQNNAAKLRVMTSVAAVWGLGSHDVEAQQELGKPALQVVPSGFAVGRVVLPYISSQGQQVAYGSPFSHTGHAVRMMERVAAAIVQEESVLLVGETGTGKTALVQHVANKVGAKLVVLNLNQQSETSDLLGGFKPISAKDALMPLLPRFANLVRTTWTRGKNEVFLSRATKYAERGNWRKLEEAFRTAAEKVKNARDQFGESKTQEGRQVGQKRLRKDGQVGQAKRQRQAVSEGTRKLWDDFERDLSAASRLNQASESAFAFSFMEGALVKALRHGWWLLLDEINLAPPEVLETISCIIDRTLGSELTLTETGGDKVTCHQDFRLFAAMNPATDAGKRNLPASMRNRFTEFWCPEPSQVADITMIVQGYLHGLGPAVPVDNIVDFYLAARNEADTILLDGGGLKPTYSLRTLCRWLLFVREMSRMYGMRRALYDGAAMAFLTVLNSESAVRMDRLIKQRLAQGPREQAPVVAPREPSGGNHVLFEQFWLEVGDQDIPEGKVSADGSGSAFVLTSSVRKNLQNLARAVALRKFPVLLQGPTSSGKTSLVSYMAARTGHKMIRINNNEYTDLQEYLGTYIADATGKLRFHEGALVQAMRKGYWVVLDELNLAPSEVLEALNRLLDDNRELFIPELQETVQPHSHFMLFATQNPPGLYAGRKVLSKAFRSRFLEMHVDDIPDDELAVILENRCGIAPSYAAKLVVVMRELQRHRKTSNAFAGKHGLITPRDLFRWADRGAIGYQELAENGLFILGEQLRNKDEFETVKKVLEKTMRVKLDIAAMYAREGNAPIERLEAALGSSSAAHVQSIQDALKKIVWTKSMCRMYTLLNRCAEHSEPALLIGETGVGKTTVCQLLALMRDQKLHIINCNQHTETSDLLGGFRPMRDREQALARFVQAAEGFGQSQLFQMCEVAPLQLPESFVGADLLHETTKAQKVLEKIEEAVLQHQGSNQNTMHDQEMPAIECHLEGLRVRLSEMISAARAARTPFTWVDGPLVDAMRNGDLVLIDELNLAEDAVIERINSVLEVGRTLTLTEKGGETAEVIKASEGFQIIATMNPGGDYGKKELSPALSNRFTQIWVPPIDNGDELLQIVKFNLSDDLMALADFMIGFWTFFKPMSISLRSSLSVRDLLSWVAFINQTAHNLGGLAAYIHGAYLVVLDGVGIGAASTMDVAERIRRACQQFLRQQIPDEHAHLLQEAAGTSPTTLAGVSDGWWGVHPFCVPLGPCHQVSSDFNFSSPTPCRNALRLLRALQLRKAVLLEGSPGVGKTSLIVAMARVSGHRLVRINLSEQTDMMDLLGADLPVAGGGPGEFKWCDGPLLGAIKNGDWVLLDELNLANQQVVEGLNAVLDHRAEVFIPELGQTFKCPASFHLFGAQNPLQEGGGRKGLPRSFLNRFTRVYIDALAVDDMDFIAGSLHPSLSTKCRKSMVRMVDVLHQQVCIQHKFGTSGGPWEFNLRDLLRWCQVVEAGTCQWKDGMGSTDDLAQNSEMDMAKHYAHILFIKRFRTEKDRDQVQQILQECLPLPATSGNWKPELLLSPTTLHIGKTTVLRRQGDGDTAVLSQSQHSSQCARLGLLHGQLEYLECLAKSAECGWPCLVVGGSGSGKTSLVRVLAELCGQNLVEIALTGSTDTSDLLGGFEQVESGRKVEQVDALFQVLSQSVFEMLVTDKGKDKQKNLALAAIETVLESMHMRDVSASCTDDAIARVSLLRKATDHLQTVLAPEGHNHMGFVDQIFALQGRLNTLLEALVAEHGQRSSAGRFEWLDGSLCHAMVNGSWVLLDNANLCNPTVLDRLNAVLEPDGLLYLNECGGINGKPRVIKPHPNFRLFLAYNQMHGEVSRAMRNRSIEVFLMPLVSIPLTGELGTIMANNKGNKGSARHLCDVRTILNLEGVCNPMLADAMGQTHQTLGAGSETCRPRQMLVRDLKRWAALSQRLIGHGWDSQQALEAAWKQVHLPETESAEREFVVHIFQNGCADALLQLSPWKPEPLCCEDAKEGNARSNARGFEAILLQLAMNRCMLPIDPAASASIDQPSKHSRAYTVNRETAVISRLFRLCCASQCLQQMSTGGEETRVHISSRVQGLATQGLQHYGQLLPAPVLHACLWGTGCSENGSDILLMKCDKFARMLDAALGGCLLADMILAAGRVLLYRSPIDQLKWLEKWFQHKLEYFQGGALACGLGVQCTAAATIVVCTLSSFQKHPCIDRILHLVQPPDASKSSDFCKLQPMDVTYRSIASQLLVQNQGLNASALLHAVVWWAEFSAVQAAAQRTAATSQVLTAYQKSFLQHSRSRDMPASGPNEGAIVEWVYPLFSALGALEKMMLGTLAEYGIKCPQQVFQQLEDVREWRWTLWSCFHGDLVESNSTKDQVTRSTERIIYCWMKVQKSIRKLLNLLSIEDGQVLHRLDYVAEGMNEALDMPRHPPDRPLLWKFGGHPQLPQAEEVGNLLSHLQKTCSILHIGTDVPLQSCVGHLKLVSRVGVDESGNSAGETDGCWIDDMGVDTVASQGEPQVSGSQVVEPLVAGLASDVELRRLILEGICMAIYSAADPLSTPSTLRKLDPEGVVSEATNLIQAEISSREKTIASHLHCRHDHAAPGMPSAPDWMDKPLANLGILPKILPSMLMESAAGRQAQLCLAPLVLYHSIHAQTAILSQLTNICLTSSPVAKSALQVLPQKPQTDELVAFENTELGLFEGIASGTRCLLDLVSHRHLLWARDAASDCMDMDVWWKNCRNWTHDMWFRWHQGLWGRLLCVLPSVSTFQGAQLCGEGLPTISGPARLYESFRSMCASSLVEQPSSILETPLKALQLKLAARSIAQWAVSVSQMDSAQLLQNIWMGIACLLCQVILAHIQTVSEMESRTAVVHACSFLVKDWANKDCHKEQEYDVDNIICKLEEALMTSSHAVLRSLTGTLVVPCFHTIAVWRHSNSEEQVLHIGEAWTLLGVLRLQLVLPPRGVDPAQKSALRHQHTLSRVQRWLKPELMVRSMLQDIPSGLDESGNIQSIQTEIDNQLLLATKLKASCVPRPVPSQYAELQQEVQLFATSLGDPQRVLAVIGGVSSADAQATHVAESLCESGLALCKRLGHQYPMYCDILQPVQLGLLELCHGVALLSAVSRKIKGSGLVAESQAHVGRIVAGLMSFPTAEGQAQLSKAFHAISPSQLGEKECQSTAVSAASASTAKNDGKELSKAQQSEAVAYTTKVSMLHCALQDWKKRHSVQSLGSSTILICQELDALFSTFVELWEDLKALEDKHAEEENQLFRKKTRTTTFMTDEELEEASYLKMFPDHGKFYEDIVDDVKDTMDDKDKAEHKDIDTGGNMMATDAEASTQAAQSLIDGDLLREIVGLHCLMCEPMRDMILPTEAIDSIFERSYKLGSFLSSCNAAAEANCLTKEVDDVTASGHLLRICIEHNKLAQPASSTAAAAVKFALQQRGKASDAAKGRCRATELGFQLDMNAACVNEVLLSRDPLLSMQKHLKELLAVWPDHPLLCQLDALCKKILDLPVTAPVKQVLTGLELLLARAQVWEESAASRVSLKEELSKVAALATRWRRLELGSWGSLLETTMRRHADGANKTWFHLYRLLMLHNRSQTHGSSSDEASNAACTGDRPPVDEVCVALEQFVQSSTVGEFGRRLQLLKAFARQLQLNTRASKCLANVTHNLAVFYSQFQGDVDKAVESGLQPVRKELEDFVKLARWEDRGYYAMKSGSDRAQRRLHKFCCKAEDVLRQQAIHVISRVGESIGFKDATEFELDWASGDPIDAKQKKAKKDADTQDDMTVTPMQNLLEMTRCWRSFCESSLVNTGAGDAVQDASEAIQQVLRLKAPNLHYNSLPRLATRIKQLLSWQPEGVGLEGSNIDMLAGAAAARSQELRQDTHKQSRNRKKKALSDFLKALGDIGVSKRRSAIPAEDRYIYSWLQKPVVELETLFQGCAHDSPVPREWVAASQERWRKAYVYYYKSMARVQQLQEVSKRPSKDLSAAEVAAAQHYSEHLMHLLNGQRQTLHAAEARLRRLQEVVSVLSRLTPQRLATEADLQLPLPPQDLMKQLLDIQWHVLSRLLRTSQESEHLLCAFLHVETAPWAQLRTRRALTVLNKSTERLKTCFQSLRDSVRLGTELQKQQFNLFSHKVQKILVSNFQEVVSIYQEAVLQDKLEPDDSCPRELGCDMTKLTGSVPGFKDAVSAFEWGAEQSKNALTDLEACTRVGEVDDLTSVGMLFSAELEQAVVSMLLYVQAQEGALKATGRQSTGQSMNVGENEHCRDETVCGDMQDDWTIQKWTQTLEDQLSCGRIGDICSQVESLLQRLAEACDQIWHSENHVMEEFGKHCEEVHLNAELSQQLVWKMSSLLQQLLGPINMVWGAFIRESLRYVSLHKAVAKLTYVTASLFFGLVREGFCVQEESKDGEPDGGEGGAFKEEDGTGIGEGTGRKDVSNKIENEDQVVGLQDKGDAEEKEENRSQEHQDDAKGIEMEQEFDGDLHDVEANQDGSEMEEEEGDNERLDQEMGQTGGGETVDERLWEEEGEKHDKDDNIDNDATIPDSDKVNPDYVEGKDKDGEDASEDRKQQQHDHRPKEDAEIDFPDEEMDGGEDAPDQYQQEGFTKPERPEEELDLPDNMQLDMGGEDQDGSSHSGEDWSEAEEEPPIKEHAFPDGPDEEKDPKNDDDGEPAGQQPTPSNEKEDQKDDEEGTNVAEEAAAGRDEDAPMDDENDRTKDSTIHGEAEPMSEDDPVEGADEQQSDRAICADDDESEHVPDAEEGGPKGAASSVPAAQEQTAGEGEGRVEEERHDRKECPRIQSKTNDNLSIDAAPQSGPSAAGSGDPGEMGTAAPMEPEAGAQPHDQASKSRPNFDANPYRSLGDALERWRANLTVTQDADEEEKDAGASDGQEEDGNDAPIADEYQFMTEGDQTQGAMQTLAPANEQQTAELGVLDRTNMEEDQGEEVACAEPDEPGGPAGEDEGLAKEIITQRSVKEYSRNQRGAQAAELQHSSDDEQPCDSEEGAAEGAGGDLDGVDEEVRGHLESFITRRLQEATLEDGPTAEGVEDLQLGGLSPEQADALRDTINERLRSANEGNVVHGGYNAGKEGSEQLWHQCQTLTSGLTGELAEHLRLILEPTLTTRLAGDYRTGKRLNMKKVIPYVASHYRKDKIWLRRTKPDKRRYQVLLAVDDSKSMSENGCGTFALEALTLLCRAMSRVEVGEMGVVSFGGPGEVYPLHPLGAPFTDANGPAILGRMRFDKDNNIQDRPMVELMTALLHMLDVAQRHHQRGSASTSSQLRQLVLIIADGRFHEKDALCRMVHEASNRPGVMLTFIILDSPDNSMLDLSTVSFVDGKPQFSRYMDTFPFPYYIVLRDISALPWTLAELLRQWFQLSSG